MFSYSHVDLFSCLTGQSQWSMAICSIRLLPLPINCVGRLTSHSAVFRQFILIIHLQFHILTLPYYLAGCYRRFFPTSASDQRHPILCVRERGVEEMHRIYCQPQRSISSKGRQYVSSLWSYIYP